MDYLIPTVHEVPADVRVGHVETPSPFTEFGVKGGGEGGRMGAPPAIAAAIEDALQAARGQDRRAAGHARAPARPDPRGRSAPAGGRGVAGATGGPRSPGGAPVVG